MTKNGPKLAIFWSKNWSFFNFFKKWSIFVGPKGPIFGLIFWLKMGSPIFDRRSIFGAKFSSKILVVMWLTWSLFNWSGRALRARVSRSTIGPIFLRKIGDF